jgi:hypothetical protein
MGETLFPSGNPRPFLEERGRLLYEQSEAIRPGAQHTTAVRFAELSREFIDGSISAETLCLYTMTQYLANEDVLNRTDAGVNLRSFTADFAEYFPISNDRLVELWDDARISVAQSERLDRVHRKMRGETPLYSDPVKVLKLSRGSNGELQTEQVYPPIDEPEDR